MDEAAHSSSSVDLKHLSSLTAAAVFPKEPGV